MYWHVLNDTLNSEENAKTDNPNDMVSLHFIWNIINWNYFDNNKSKFLSW